MDFTLCLTHACNLRCAYCYAGEKHAVRMRWETARKAVDFSLGQTLKHAAAKGRAPAAQLGFFGGEPLLEWKLLQDATRHASEEAGRLGIPLKKTVTTNMTLLDEAKAAWLMENHFWVGLSLDGNAAMHDTLRVDSHGCGSHAKCMAALAYYRGSQANGEVIVVIDPRNVAHLAESVEWLIAEDIRNIALNPNFMIDWPDPALHVWRAAYERIADLYANSYRQAQPVRINVSMAKSALTSMAAMPLATNAASVVTKSPWPQAEIFTRAPALSGMTTIQNYVLVMYIQDSTKPAAADPWPGQHGRGMPDVPAP